VAVRALCDVTFARLLSLLTEQAAKRVAHAYVSFCSATHWNCLAFRVIMSKKNKLSTRKNSHSHILERESFLLSAPLGCKYACGFIGFRRPDQLLLRQARKLTS